MVSTIIEVVRKSVIATNGVEKSATVGAWGLAKYCRVIIARDRGIGVAAVGAES